MNNRKVKIVVDIFMSMFLVLSFVRWSGNDGLVFHSIVGTGFTMLMVAHLYLNRKWLVSTTKSIKEGKANKKLKQLYVVDIALIVVWSVAIVTGFLAIPWFVNNLEAFSAYSRIHSVTSRIGGVIILIHIYQHLGHIRSYLRLSKRPKN